MRHYQLSVTDVIRMVKQNPNPAPLELTLVSGLELQQERIKELENALEAAEQDRAAVRITQEDIEEFGPGPEPAPPQGQEEDWPTVDWYEESYKEDKNERNR